VRETTIDTFRPLLDGTVNWPAVLDALDRVGYRGYLTFEYFNPFPIGRKPWCTTLRTPSTVCWDAKCSRLMPEQPRRGSLAVIFLTVFIDLLGFGMVLPLLPIYARQFTEDPRGWRLGLLMAVFSIMQLLFAPLWGDCPTGWAGDRC